MHGAIDGWSRIIRYLQCNNNNSVATVLHLFVDAISIQIVPSRVRANFSVKNVDGARFILDCPEGGINRVSYTAGTSVYNNCVEGLCGEVMRCSV